MALTILDQTQVQSQTNIQDNAGFEIWQRGTTFTNPALLAYTADRYLTDTTETTGVTVTKETTTIDSQGLTSMKVVVSTAGASTYWRVQDRVENYADYRGRTLSLSARVNTNVANAIKIGIGDTTDTFSSYHTGSGTWETLTVTKTIDPAAIQLRTYFGMVNAGDKKLGTYYFDSAMFTVATGPSVFIPINPEVDFARCQRYFQVVGGTATIHSAGLAAAPTAAIFTLYLPVEMRAAPALTVNNATNFRATNGAGTPIAATVVSNAGVTTRTQSLEVDVAAGLTTGQASLMQTSNTNATLFLSADL